jgi:hypothetical protein
LVSNIIIMFQDASALYPEFLAESNIALNQEDDGNQLAYLLTPIRQLLQSKQRPFTAFALARAAGAPSQLAFFAEWSSFVGQVLQNLHTLSEYNYEYFASLAGKDARSTEVISYLQDLSKGQILTMQIAFLNQKLEQLRLDTFTRFGEVSRFVTYAQFHKVFTAENLLSRTLVSPKTTLAQYLDVLAGGFSFYTVGLPVLCGITYSMREYDTVLDTSKIQWSMIDSILKNISLLVRTTNRGTLALFLKEQVVGNKVEWFAAGLQERLDLALGDGEIVDQIKQIRTKVYDRTKKDIEYVVLPAGQKAILEQLIAWSFSLSQVDN